MLRISSKIVRGGPAEAEGSSRRLDAVVGALLAFSIRRCPEGHCRLICQAQISSISLASTCWRYAQHRGVKFIAKSPP
jgi:hypothetical protein